VLGRDDLTVDVAFLARVLLGGQAPLPVVSVCVRLDFSNYDLWAPSVTFLDVFTRAPIVGGPHVQAITVENGEVANVVVTPHPRTGGPFLCLPGIREYHSHPQHDGDDWLLHRGAGEGSLWWLCEQIWLRMARNVIGFQVMAATMGSEGPAIVRQAQFALVQGDPDALAAQLAAQAVAAPHPAA
jgi:hypothetical protein